MNAPELDAMLARAKGPLRALRDQYGVTADLTFRIWYAPTGEVTNVAFHVGPPNLPPSFVTESCATVRGVIAFPRTIAGGELVFTDLGPGSAVSATAVNAASDHAVAMAASAKRKSSVIIAAIVLGIILALYLATAIPKRKCIERGVEYYKSIGSYPTLSTGRNAEEVAEERCRRTDNAAFE